MSLSPLSLATPNAASRLSTKVKVVELRRKPKVLNHPQAAGLGPPPSFAHGPLYAVFPRSSTDNILSAQRQGRSENISRLPCPPPIDLPVSSLSPSSTALKSSGDIGKTSAFRPSQRSSQNCADPEGRVIVVAVPRLNCRFGVNLHMFYMVSLVVKSLRTSVANEVGVNITYQRSTTTG